MTSTLPVGSTGITDPNTGHQMSINADGSINTSGSFSAASLAINDPVTTANKATVDSGGNIHVAIGGPLAAGTNVIGHVIVDSAGNVSITSLPSLPAGSAVIGHVIVDSASSVAVSSLPSLPAGSATIGGVKLIDSAGTNVAGVDSSNNQLVKVNAALPAGTNVIGHVIVDSAGSVSITSLPALPAGTNVIGHIIVDSGTITANAGTNLNTSLLALESGGNLASIKADADSIVTNTTGLATAANQSAGNTSLGTVATNTGRIPAQGAAATAASTPVNIASDQTVPIKRNTVAVYTLASTTTSGATQNSGDLTVGPYTEISIDVTTTAQAGTSPTIQYFWERKGADGLYYPLWQSAVLTAAANTLSTSVGAGMAYNQSLGLTGRLRWVIGGTSTPTFTHSLNIYAK